MIRQVNQKKWIYHSTQSFGVEIEEVELGSFTLKLWRDPMTFFLCTTDSERNAIDLAEAFLLRVMLSPMMKSGVSLPRTIKEPPA